MRRLLARLVNRLENLPLKEQGPAFCCFGITDKCILKCRMCHKWKDDISAGADAPVPDIRQWKEAIKSLRLITEEGFLINFGGGEPLLKEGILDLIRFAADHGFKTNIPSNAFLIDEKMAKAIGASGLSSINLSLDSMNPKTHDHLRGVPGVYEKVMQAIEYLDRSAPGVKKGICAVIYDINMDEITELAEAVQRDNRLEWIYFMAAMQPNNTPNDPGWYKGEFNYLWPKDAKKACSVIDRLLELKGKGHKIVNQKAQLEAFKSYFSSPGSFVKMGGCNLSRALHISATGDVFICFRWPRLGNIRSDRLQDLWRSSRASEVRKDISGCKRNCHFLINCFFEGDFPFLT